MARFINIPSFADERGILSTLEGALPFSVRRIFFIHSVPQGAKRGGHRHHETTLLLLCVSGSCEVLVKREGNERRFRLDRPDTGLLLDPEEWRLMENFSEGAVLLAAASTAYDPSDYICEPA